MVHAEHFRTHHPSPVATISGEILSGEIFLRSENSSKSENFYKSVFYEEEDYKKISERLSLFNFSVKETTCIDLATIWDLGISKEHCFLGYYSYSEAFCCNGRYYIPRFSSWFKQPYSHK